MHCPRCGQQQISDETRYCSRCGFLLTAIAAVVANEGELPEPSAVAGNMDSPRRRGIKQGIFILLLAILIVPLAAMFHLATGTEPFLVAISAILLVAGGLLRTTYALMFEASAGGGIYQEGEAKPKKDRRFGRSSKTPELSAPAASVYSAPGAGVWRDTNELATVPGSVTDTTTKLLPNEKDAQ